MKNTVLPTLCLLLASWSYGCGTGSDAALASTSSAGVATTPSQVSVKTVTTTSPAALARLTNTQWLARFSLTSDWGSGFTGAFEITNQDTQTLTDWNLEFDLPAGVNITEIWNARVLRRSGNHFVLGAESWNQSIPAGQKISLGFNGSPGGNVSASNISVTTSSASSGNTTSGNTTSGGSGATQSGSARFVVESDWGSGFVGRIEVQGPLQDWTVEFDWDRTITSVWNGQMSRSGQRYRIIPADYNRSVAAGTTLVIGMQGAPSAGSGPAQITVTTSSASSPSPSPSPTATPTATPTVTPTATPTATPTPPPQTQTTGWLSTQGARIVNQQGQTVLLRGVNWFGLETYDFAPHGLWSRSLDSMVSQMASLGYNCIRLPYSNQLFDANQAAPNINYSANPTLQGKRGVELIDAVVASAKAHGMKVVLDRHRPDAGGQSELWYTAAYSEERWISDWEMLARRYINEPTVIGCDLHNEPHGSATWGDGSNRDWRAAAQRCGNRILAINPNLLILVEGVESVDGDNYWWGGNLKKAGTHPVQLNTPNRVVYAPHDYPSTVYAQSWFNASNYPANLDGVWDSHWGFIAKNNQAPVLLGEFGTKYQSNSDKAWLGRLLSYLGGNGLSFTYWSWNPNSGDTGGILNDDWQSINTAKQAVLQPYLSR